MDSYRIGGVFTHGVLVEEKPCYRHRPLRENLERGGNVFPDGDKDGLAGGIKTL